jgi:hypothetical protein
LQLLCSADKLPRREQGIARIHHHHPARGLINLFSIQVATNQATLLRQWHMLRLIPRAPGKISVQDLRDALSAAVMIDAS